MLAPMYFSDPYYAYRSFERIVGGSCSCTMRSTKIREPEKGGRKILTPEKWYPKDQGHPVMTWNPVMGGSQGSLGNLDNSSSKLDGKQSA